MVLEGLQQVLVIFGPPGGPTG